MKLIVAVSEDWGIGKENQMLFHISEDLKFFKETTMGHSVVMGHNTFKSIGKPLSGRKNYVLSRDKGLQISNVQIIRSISDIPKDAFIIGGQEIYEQTLSHCETAFITKIHASKDCDRYFPNLDKNKDWKIKKKRQIQIQNGTLIDFLIYKKIKG